MKNIIKQLIIEFHHEELPASIPRELEIPAYPKNIRKAYVFMGMRRTGKTWVIYHHIQTLLKEGRAIEKMLYLNFEDDRLLSFQAENFQDILSAYFDLYPQYANDDEVVFCFDEIQVISGWEKFIRRLLDKENFSIYVTGSSAKMLSKELATSLRGRTISTEIFPFSFREYLMFHQVSPSLPLTTKNQSLIRHHCQSYLQQGGFPETLFIPPDQHRELLQEYVNTVIFRDVIERYQLSNVPAIKLFLLHCLQNFATTLSITKIYHFLKSQGASVGKNSLYEYLAYFEEAYLLFSVSIYDLSLRKRLIHPTKIYAIDPGILSAYSINTNFNQGPIFENAVFLQLRRQYTDIFYYKTVSDKEIDFVVLMPDGSLALYQCCIEMSLDKTRNREVSALIEAAQELGTKALFIITFDTESEIQENDHTIQVLPYWKWALLFPV